MIIFVLVIDGFVVFLEKETGLTELRIAVEVVRTEETSGEDEEDVTGSELKGNRNWGRGADAMGIDEGEKLSYGGHRVGVQYFQYFKFKYYIYFK